VSLAHVSNVVFYGKVSNGIVNFITGDRVAIYFENVTDVSIVGMRFLSNSSPLLDFHNSAKVHIRNAEFIDSRFLSSRNSEIILTKCLFDGNSGCLQASNSIISIYQSGFEQNTGIRTFSGALDAVNSTLRITDSTFSGNSADIGGVLHASNCIIDIMNCSFTMNRAIISGGALALNQSELYISFSLFRGNQGVSSHGAIGAIMSNITLTSCVFSNNSASLNIIGGGAIGVDKSIIYLTNSSFYNNTAFNGGGAVYANASVLHLLGNIFARNSVEFGTTAILVSSSVLYRNETYSNIFAGGARKSISCKNCRIEITGKNDSIDVFKAHVTGFSDVGQLIRAPSVVAIYSDSKSPGTAFIGIVSSPGETKIILSNTPSQGDGEKYLLYSIKNPKTLSFYQRRQLTTLGGRTGFLSFSRAMLDDRNFYNDLARAINDDCSSCNLTLMGVAYFPKGNSMPAYYYKA
jgi:predicted outer membrane repeat protein